MTNKYTVPSTRTTAKEKINRLLSQQGASQWGCCRICNSSHNLRLIAEVSEGLITSTECVIYIPFESLGYPVDLWKAD